MELNEHRSGSQETWTRGQWGGHFVGRVAVEWAWVSSPALSPRSLVIDTLKEVGETRRCYRMVGGVLVERTVKEVLPALESNKEQVSRRGLRLQTLPRSHAPHAVLHPAPGHEGRGLWAAFSRSLTWLVWGGAGEGIRLEFLTVESMVPASRPPGGLM